MIPYAFPVFPLCPGFFNPSLTRNRRAGRKNPLAAPRGRPRQGYVNPDRPDMGRKVARLTGLEPATPGVTGRYSNRLSYNRVTG